MKRFFNRILAILLAVFVCLGPVVTFAEEQMIPLEEMPDDTQYLPEEYPDSDMNASGFPEEYPDSDMNASGFPEEYPDSDMDDSGFPEEYPDSNMDDSGLPEVLPGDGAEYFYEEQVKVPQTYDLEPVEDISVWNAENVSDCFCYSDWEKQVTVWLPADAMLPATDALVVQELPDFQAQALVSDYYSESLLQPGFCFAYDIHMENESGGQEYVYPSQIEIHFLNDERGLYSYAEQNMLGILCIRDDGGYQQVSETWAQITYTDTGICALLNTYPVLPGIYVFCLLENAVPVEEPVSDALVDDQAALMNEDGIDIQPGEDSGVIETEEELTENDTDISQYVDNSQLIIQDETDLDSVDVELQNMEVDVTEDSGNGQTETGKIVIMEEEQPSEELLSEEQSLQSPVEMDGFDETKSDEDQEVQGQANAADMSEHQTDAVDQAGQDQADAADMSGDQADVVDLSEDQADVVNPAEESAGQKVSDQKAAVQERADSDHLEDDPFENDQSEDDQSEDESPEDEQPEDGPQGMDHSDEGQLEDIRVRRFYQYEDDFVLVNATLQYADAVPDDAVLVVTPITSDSQDYQYDAYMEALNGANEGDLQYSEENTLLYDIAFMVPVYEEISYITDLTAEEGCGTGSADDADVDVATAVQEEWNEIPRERVMTGYQEYEPEAGSVTIQMQFKQGQLSGELSADHQEQIEIAHLETDPEMEKTEVCAEDIYVETMDASVSLGNSDTPAAAPAGDYDAADHVEFTTDSFSVYAFTCIWEEVEELSELTGSFENISSAYFSLPADSDVLMLEYFDAGVDAGIVAVQEDGQDTLTALYGISDTLESMESSEFFEASLGSANGSGTQGASLGSSDYNGDKLENYYGNSFTKRLYDGLKNLAVNVAAGTRTQTSYTMSITESELQEYSWTAQDLDVDSLLTSGDEEGTAPKINSAAAFTAVNRLFNRSLAVRSVIRDCPYEMFWFGNKIYYSTKPSVKVVTGSDQIQRLQLTAVSFTVKLEVSPDYRGSDSFTTDFSSDGRLNRINSAIDNAQAILQGAYGSDETIMTYYKDQIKQYSEYNREIANMPKDYYGDPWQIIFLFDGDTSTKVVCEGYSKGFQYLCDKTQFTGNVQVYTVTGLIYSSTWSGGGHMWNIVAMNGHNYMVDITNCSMAEENKNVFLAKPISGSAESGYVFLIKGNVEKNYHYDYYYETTQMYSSDELSFELYHELDQDGQQCIYCDYHTEEEIILQGTCGDELTWNLTNYHVLTIEGTGAMANGSSGSATGSAAFGSDAFTVTYVNPSWSGQMPDAASVKKVVLGQGVQSIGDYAFRSFNRLSEIVLTDSVESIGAGAFENCTNLTSVTIPYSVSAIGENAFENSGLNHLVYIGAESEWNDTGHIHGSGFNQLKTGIQNHTISIEFLGGTGTGKLSGTCGSSLSWSISGQTLTISGSGAMTDYVWQSEDETDTLKMAPWSWAKDRITTITWSGSPTTIGNSAFNGFSQIRQITIPDTVHSVGSHSFNGCNEVTSVFLPSSVVNLGEMAFAACENLNFVELKGTSKLQKIGKGAFFHCYALSSLKEQTQSGSGVILPASLTVIDELAFCGCKSLTFVQLPSNDELDSISYGAFADCTGLKSIVIPRNIQDIAGYTFYHCESLKSVIIPAGVSTINEITFCGCTALQQISIPVSVTGIMDNAFADCNRLSTVLYGGTKALWDRINISEGNENLLLSDKEYNKCPAGSGTHVWQLQKSTEASCTAAGSETWYCPECGDTMTVEVSALGHSWDAGKVTKAPTCTASGVRTYTCSRCGATKTAAIAAAGHKVVTDRAVAATCTSSGKTAGSHCSACGKVMKAQSTTSALGHSWDAGKVTKEPTCTSAGTRTYTCTRCGATKTSSIPATGHKVVADRAVAATCTSSGKTAGSHCSVCGKVITAQSATSALGHSWDAGKVTKAPTCTTTGVKTYTCSRCGATKTSSIPAAGHKPVTDPAVAASCVSGGKTAGSHCSVCGKILIAQSTTPALGHDWDAGKVTKAATCTTTGVKTYTCSRCGATKTSSIPAAGHKPVTDLAVAASCTSGGKTSGSHCQVCGKVLTAQRTTPALQHSWNQGVVTTPATRTAPGVKTYTCTRCKAKRTETIPASGFSDLFTDGIVTAGWIFDGAFWYYLNSDGTARTGWLYDNGFWYYLNEAGQMQTGWLWDGAAWYYLNAGGAMVTGWLQDGGAWYYLGTDGAMVTGWLWDGNAWYYLGTDGAMVTGWLWDGAAWYYLNAGGAMVTGWLQDGGAWYYLAPSGVMQTGWIWDGAAWYYLRPDGSMATGWIWDNGQQYYLNESGVWEG